MVVVAALVALVLMLGPDDTRLDADGTDLLADVRRFAAGLSTTAGYTRPSRAERAAVVEGVRRALAGRWRAAGTALARAGYVLHRRVDAATGRVFHELSDGAAAPRGWGRVVIDTGSTVHFGIQVPHPRADVASELLGVQLFRRVPGSVLVVAGAHRRAAPGRVADVAHAPESVFQSVHELLVRLGLPVVQLHGFQNATAPGSDVVVSAGPGLRSSFVDGVARRLEAAGLAVCRPWRTGGRGLAGTTNVQARWSAARGGEFAHVEVSRRVRDAAGSRELVVSALAAQAVVS